MEMKKAFSECWIRIQDDQGVSQWQEIVLEQLTKTAALQPDHNSDQI